MPQVVIASDASSNSDSECGATGYVLLAPSHARFEYIELLRGELTALRKRPVLLAQLDVTGRGGAASRRSQAWELAAELVMSN
jgi:hypothetical protein